MDFSGSWEDALNGLEKGIGFDNFLNLLAVIGVLIVVFAIGAWAFKKATGKNVPGGQGGIGGALILGALLCAPKAIIPIVLQIIDLLVNAVVGIGEENTKQN